MGGSTTTNYRHITLVVSQKATTILKIYIYLNVYLKTLAHFV